MKYTMTHVIAKSDAMQTRRAVSGEREFAVKKDFDSRGLSHDSWLTIVYPDAKLFLKGLTKDNFIELLDTHREVKEEREQRDLSMERHPHILFQFMDEERVFPLKEKYYDKVRKSLGKKKKIASPVFFLVDLRPELITLDEATKIVKERKDREEKMQESEICTEDLE